MNYCTKYQVEYSNSDGVCPLCQREVPEYGRDR